MMLGGKATDKPRALEHLLLALIQHSTVLQQSNVYKTYLSSAAVLIACCCFFTQKLIY